MEFRNTYTINNLDLKQIAESGQCFRWVETEENTYLIPGESYACRDREPVWYAMSASSISENARPAPLPFLSSMVR